MTLAETWGALERLVDEGHCKSIGLSDITLEKLRNTLRDGSGEVKVEPAIAELARVPIERMVSINP